MQEIQTMKKDVRKVTLLPTFLGALGLSMAFTWFLLRIEDIENVIKVLLKLNKYGFTVFYVGTNFTFLVLPMLLTLIGALLMKRKPILCGICFLAAGIMYLLSLLASLLVSSAMNFLLSFPATFLIIGGLLTLSRNKVVLEKRKK